MNFTELQDYWNSRFRLYGHIGWKIPELHTYDQKVHLKAVINFLAQLGFLIEESKSILDIGCGSGDFGEEFAKQKAHRVGFDIRNHLIES